MLNTKDGVNTVVLVLTLLGESDINYLIKKGLICKAICVDNYKWDNKVVYKNCKYINISKLCVE